MGSIATWKVRVPVRVEFGEDRVDAVLVIKRASVEEREAFTELRDDAAKHMREFAPLVKGADLPTDEQQARLRAESARLASRMKTQVIDHVIGVAGVEVETAPGAKSVPKDGESLVAALGGDAPVVGTIWKIVADAQFVTPELGEAYAATPGS